MVISKLLVFVWLVVILCYSCSQESPIDFVINYNNEGSTFDVREFNRNVFTARYLLFGEVSDQQIIDSFNNTKAFFPGVTISYDLQNVDDYGSSVADGIVSLNVQNIFLDTLVATLKQPENTNFDFMDSMIITQKDSKEVLYRYGYSDMTLGAKVLKLLPVKEKKDIVSYYNNGTNYDLDISLQIRSIEVPDVTIGIDMSNLVFGTAYLSNNQ